MDRMKLNDRATVSLTRKRPIADALDLLGKIRIEHWRSGRLLDIYDFNNTVVNVGKNKILDVMFNSATPITTWYIGLISSASYSVIAAADTMGSHAGWTEFTGYSESVRQTWGSGAAASQSVTNATPATFTANTGGTVKGIFVTSVNTKGGTTGTLWSAGLFSGGDVTVASSDELKTTYTLSC
jgi:hypothetical protein